MQDIITWKKPSRFITKKVRNSKLKNRIVTKTQENDLSESAVRLLENRKFECSNEAKPQYSDD